MNNKTAKQTKGNIMADNPFEIEQKTYVSFPNDKYINACILSYQTAMLPPGPLAETNDPVLSVRFLFGGYTTDDNNETVCDDTGAPILVRKWTSWLRISFSKNAKLMKLFKDKKIQNLADILKDNATSDGALWKTEFKIQLEETDNAYQNITSVKLADKPTGLCDQAFYDEKFVPYKVVKAYGKPQPLTLAGCKFKTGVKTYEPSEMADAPQD